MSDTTCVEPDVALPRLAPIPRKTWHKVMVGSLGLLILVIVIAAIAAPAEKTPAAKTAAPAVTHHRRHLTNQQKGAREMHSIFKTCRSWARQVYSLREVAGLMSAYNRANGFQGAVADYTITTCAGGFDAGR
jgi:hypothetical protein